MHKLLSFTAVLSILFFASAATAEEINIHADNKVEWHSKEQKMVAVGNAVASKKDMSIRAQELTAYYQKVPSTGKQQISKVLAKDNVIMKSGQSSAYGDNMDYDLIADKAVLRGRPAKVKTETDTITAEEHITYYPSQQKAVAEGNVFATNGESKIYSDSMIAYFEKDAAGKTAIKQVKVFGNVKILTKDGTVWADRGTYLPKQGLIKLYDNITLDQNGNKLHGDLAETDLNTGISKMLTAPGTKKRVTGVFIEKSKEKDNKKTSTPAAEEKKDAQ